MTTRYSIVGIDTFFCIAACIQNATPSPYIDSSRCVDGWILLTPDAIHLLLARMMLTLLEPKSATP